jgi:hypothetical protein
MACRNGITVRVSSEVELKIKVGAERPILPDPSRQLLQAAVRETV